MKSDKIFIPFELNDDDVLLYFDDGADPDIYFFSINSPTSQESTVNIIFRIVSWNIQLIWKKTWKWLYFQDAYEY